MIAVGCGDRTAKLSTAPEGDEDARLTFVQWSDPHVFDAGAARSREGIEEEKLDNWSALHWAVVQTNRLILLDHRNIDFVVLTGDFGLYNVKVPDLRDKTGKIKSDGKCVRDSREGPGPTVPFDEAVRLAAQEFRALLVKRVYLVPGNNDLCDEDPRDRYRYAAFVVALQRTIREEQKERQDDLKVAANSVIDEQTLTKVPNPHSDLPVNPPAAPEIVDLTFTLEDLLQKQLPDAMTAPLDNILSEEEKAAYLRSKPLVPRPCGNSAGSFPVIKGYCLLGLDSSYFKAHTDARGITLKIQDAADKASILAMNRLDGQVQPGMFYLLFTHIPDIEDPHPGRKSDPGSSWLLPANARSKWKDVLNRSELIAVFAGHFHSRTRNIYPHNFSYVKALDPVVGQKFWLAPALAAKYQTEPLEGETARGIVLFQMMRKDVAAKAPPPDSPVWGLPIWFSPLDPNPTLGLEFYRQLKLGDIYEKGGRRGQAEAAYRKALDVATGKEREVALKHIEGVVNTWGFYELWIQKRRGIVESVAPVVLLLCLIFVVWMFWRRTRRLQIYPLEAPNDAKVPGAHLEQVAEYLVGLMRYYAAKTGPISATKLPFIWSGFSKDLGQALEKLVPGKSSGLILSLLGWLFKPDYVLKGSLVAASANLHVVLTLNGPRDVVSSWEKSAPLDQAHDTLKDMVYAVLLYMKNEPR
jgi:hypothetical protein